MNTITILLVDDDEVLSRVLQRVLAREGYAVLEAGNVAQALQLAHAHRPQLGLFDLALPDGDGVELARQLDDDGLNFPRILITAYPLRLREHPELSERFARVLTKPLNLDELRQTIHAALARSAPAENLERLQPAAGTPTAVPPLPVEEQTQPAAGREQAPAEAAVSEDVREPAPKRRRLPVVLMVVAAALILFFALPLLGVPGIPNLFKQREGQKEQATSMQQQPAVHLVDGDPNGLEVLPETVKSVGIRTEAVPRQVTPRLMVLSGSLAFDPNHLYGVQARFAGEVISIPEIKEPAYDTFGSPGQRERPLHFGDRVKQGDLLAVVWSKDLGEKKSELVDALSQLHLDKTFLENLDKLWDKGGISEAVYRQAERNVKQDLNAVARAERTLKTWKVPDEEVDAVEQEARNIIARQGKHDPDKEKNWARVEVRAPYDGTIVEKNVTLGRMVDPTFDLYKVANLRTMAVYVHAYEEDMRTLQQLRDKMAPRRVPWEVRLTADPRGQVLKSEGIEQIGYVVDPNQHTDIVWGVVDNSDRELTAGQFVTATVPLPPPPGVVSVPLSALVEDGSESIVFVQPDPGKERYFSMRRVAAVQRFHGGAYVRSELTEAEKARGLQELKPGERIVTQGGMELKAALEDAQSQKQNGNGHEG
jgi:cobalt-zinc-cadmium efflux system membrane fusion protein